MENHFELNTSDEDFFLFYDLPSDQEEDLDPDYDEAYIAMMKGNEDHIL